MAAVILIAVGQLSRSLTPSDPAAALALNPLNTDARVNASLINLDAVGTDRAALEAGALTALRFAPGSVRAASLIGEIESRFGSKDQAQTIFAAALDLSKTDLLALQRRIVGAVEEQDYAVATRHLDILLRRWPDRFADIAKAIPALMADQTAYKGILAALAEGAPWRGKLLTDLARGAAPVLAYRLLVDLRATPAPPTEREYEQVVGGLLTAQYFDDAFRTYLLSLGDAPETIGYVQNGSFRRPTYNRIFDWQFGDTTGVQVQVQEGAARLRFLGKPVRRVDFLQFVLLPAGAYTLSVTASAADLRVPRGLVVQVACRGKPASLLKLEFDEGSYRSRVKNAGFTVPGADCPAQTIAVQSGLTADSWKFRYEGALTIENVTVEQVTN